MREASKILEMIQILLSFYFCSKNACIGKHVLVMAASNSTVMSKFSKWEGFS